MGINKVLEKFKLVKTFDAELNVGKEAFINTFKKRTEKGYYPSFLMIFDHLKTENKKYIGDFKENSFIIRQRFIVDNALTNNFASVKFEFYQQNNKLNVKTRIRGMEIIPFILRVIIFGIYLLMMLLLVIELLMAPLPTEIDMAYVFPPIFITILVGFLTYLPYRIAKKNVVNMENDIDVIYRQVGIITYNNP